MTIENRIAAEKDAADWERVFTRDILGPDTTQVDLHYWHLYGGRVPDGVEAAYDLADSWVVPTEITL